MWIFHIKAVHLLSLFLQNDCTCILGRKGGGNSVCIVTNVTELHGLGRLTHSYSGSTKGKVGKSRMETRKRTLFFLCMCMSSKKKKKHKYRAVGFSENCSLRLDSYSYVGCKKCLGSFSKLFSTFQIHCEWFELCIFLKPRHYFTLDMDKRPIIALLF